MKTQPKIKLSDLHLNDGSRGLPKNPRFIRDERFKKLCDSIRDFPEAMPARGIVVDERGVILGGNMRYRACLELGMKEVPAEWVHQIEGLSVEKKRRFIIMDNRAFGDDDMDLLANEWDIDELIGAGFDEEDLTGLDDKDDGQDAEPQMDKAEDLNKEWKVKPGDLWQIGEHRLICGDCTDKAVVERVMGGERADIIFTDPPYGISREGIINDELTGKEFDSFNAKWLAVIPFNKDAFFICYHSTRTFPSVLFQSIKQGWNFERMLWFYRPDKFPAHTWNGWMMVSQAIMLFARGAGEYMEISPADQDTYRRTVKDLGEASGHPTEKITEQCVCVMKHMKGDTVYDPFLGSGTTMVACQNLNRKCRGVEISPAYCAVILQRMTDAFPGIKIARVK